MNIFKQKWITKTQSLAKGLTSMIEEESAGADKYHEIAETFSEMAEQEEGHKEALEEIEAEKTQVQKPGPSIHSAKWDRCVAEVGKDPSVNAYAVCTAQLGEESFKSNMTKSELSLAKAELMKAIDITQAGGIPKTLLAEQDLEGETKKTELDETGKELDEEIKQAENSSDFVENIKAIQLKRQKATIEERSNKTFKNNWKEKYGKK